MDYWYNDAQHVGMVYGLHMDVIRFNRLDAEQIAGAHAWEIKCQAQVTERAALRSTVIRQQKRTATNARDKSISRHSDRDVL